MVLLFSTSSALAQTGFVWASKPTASSYTPDPTYSYNSRGGAVQVFRGGTGDYKVLFSGLGGRTKAGGNVQVTAYGSGSETCKVVNWASNGDDFTIKVRCFAAAGGLVDTRFTALVGWWGQ